MVAGSPMAAVVARVMVVVIVGGIGFLMIIAVAAMMKLILVIIVAWGASIPSFPGSTAGPSKARLAARRACWKHLT